LYAPKGTDPEIIRILDAATKKIVLENKEYAAEIKKVWAQTPYYEDTAQTRETLKKALDAFMEVKDELRAGFKN
jgi:tripartite-type tricarboxylate transporter receptor subunit TctC